MALIAPQFLFHFAWTCPFLGDMPQPEDTQLLDLPERCRVENFSLLEGGKGFADVRLAWNEHGLGVQCRVNGKSELPQANASNPRSSDGLTLWVDTRGTRGSHRAKRHSHQFHFLPTGGGPELDEPVWLQRTIHCCSEEAPQAAPGEVLFRSRSLPGGYTLEAFLTAGALHGFDPEQSPKMSFFYAVRDAELGEQTLSVNADFPYAEDPSLWSILELAR